MVYSKSEIPPAIISLSKILKTPVASAGWNMGLPEIYQADRKKAVIGDLITPDEELCEYCLEDDELFERVCELERKIQNRPLENILAIDECGNVIMHLIGDFKRVSMGLQYWDSAKVITHNHPNGATLSGTDVSHLFDTDCMEIRACSFNTWYSVKITDEALDIEDLDAEKVERELSAILNEEVIKSLQNSCRHNGFEIEIDSESKTVKPVKPENMSNTEFLKRIALAKREQHILSIVYTHKAMKDYTAANKIKYEVGEL